MLQIQLIYIYPKMGANESKEGNENTVAGLAGTVAVLALGAYGLYGVFGSGSGQRNTMKAPERGYRIFGGDFEHDPSAYFRDLRK